MTGKRDSSRPDFGWLLRSPLLAALLLAGGVAALMLAPSVATARSPSRRAPAIAHASSDCDGDGDPEDTLDPLECGGNLQKPEPGKLYSKGEKHKFEESALEIRRGEGKICGTTGASFATRAALLTIFTLGGEFHFIALCHALNKLAQESKRSLKIHPTRMSSPSLCRDGQSRPVHTLPSGAATSRHSPRRTPSAPHWEPR